VTYYTNASRADRVGPNDLSGSIAILAAPGQPGEIVGIASGAGHVGGWRWGLARMDRGPVTSGRGNPPGGW
jgi:hypothetical protein